MSWSSLLLGLLIGLIVGGIAVAIFYYIKNVAAEKKAENVLDKAQKEAEKIKKDYLAEAKEEAHKLKVETDARFESVHGEIKLHYAVCKNKNIILLNNITPEDILNEAYSSELETYKGVIVSKSNPEKDIFKINLVDMLRK